MYRAMSWLPTSEATIERDESGKLFITWLSPCVEIGRFTIAIRSREIMLGCEISHTHFDITRYLSRVRITNMGLKRRIIRDSIEEAALFLQGGIAASISYDATGKRHGSGWCRVEQLAHSLAYTRKIFGSGMSMRAWGWSGEIALDASLAPIDEPPV
jgi:hypothetical protein